MDFGDLPSPCVIVANHPTQLDPTVMMAVLGEACTIDGDFDSGQDDCALGHMCVAVNEGAPVCVAICGGSWDTPSCPPDTSMVINSSICVCLAD